MLNVRQKVCPVKVRAIISGKRAFSAESYIFYHRGHEEHKEITKKYL
jgi:hypothetical protein